MSSFEQNIENILNRYDDGDFDHTEYDGKESRLVREDVNRQGAIYALIQAHQDDLLAVIGEDEPDPGLTLAIGGISNQPQRERLWTRNDLRAEQRTHLTQETGND